MILPKPIKVSVTWCDAASNDNWHTLKEPETNTIESTAWLVAITADAIKLVLNRDMTENTVSQSLVIPRTQIRKCVELKDTKEDPLPELDRLINMPVSTDVVQS